jgi:ASC-1-like (ASCH) protein
MNFGHPILPMSFSFLIYCSSVNANEHESVQPSQRPTMQQIMASSMPSYKANNGVIEECLGRLVWTADKTIAWPVRYDRDQSSTFNHGFSEHVFSRGDEIRFGNTLIKVNVLDVGVKEAVLASLPENSLSDLNRQLASMEAELQKTEKRKDGDIRERNRYEVAKRGIKSTIKTINEITQKYKPYEPGLPESYGYWTTSAEPSGNGDQYSTFKAYLFTPKYLYTFQSREKIGPKFSSENHRKQFSSLLASFRTRRMNEIPTELGVCIPFGFLPDDGRTVTDIKQSVRWTDTPGVLYTIHTGNVHPRQLKSTVMAALAASQVGRFGSNEEAQVKQYVDQRIGPRQVSIGGLIGEQGGVALKVTQSGAAPYEAYSVFTGYAGWLGTDVLPFILVDMQSFTLEQAPELKVNPPPFKQSMDRLEGMLKNMRLRPTSPPMPELVGGR